MSINEQELSNSSHLCETPSDEMVEEEKMREGKPGLKPLLSLCKNLQGPDSIWQEPEARLGIPALGWGWLADWGWGCCPAPLTSAAPSSPEQRLSNCDLNTGAAALLPL